MDKKRLIGWLILIVLFSGSWLSSCKPESVIVVQATPSSPGEVDTVFPQTILLPTPRLEGRITIEEALTKKWERAYIVEYARQNSWDSRVDILVEEFAELSSLKK